ncbi:MAG: AmmeMemoRadiSam system protein B [Candidatus Binataceae bacterium]
MDKPKIRPVEAFPIEHQDQMLICLRDPAGLAPEAVLLGMGAYFLVTMFDGSNTLLDLQAAFAKRFGDIIPAERLNELITALDKAGFLESPAFAERLKQVREEFSRSPERPAIHAGLCYEQEPAKLREEIIRYFDPPAGPGTVATSGDGPPLAGLIAPHIDPRRGGPAYAHAYGELVRRKPPELVVILGTSHYGTGPELFTATRKHYSTPLGALETDRDFIERLAARYTRGDLFADELLHRNEHSIEFQALFTAWALGTHGYKVVPILLCSFHEMVARGVTPASDPRVGAMIDALGAELAAERRSTLVIAGVDFAHVGRKFGDSFSVDEGVVNWVKRDDLALIETITRGDPAAFFADIARDGDRRRICGFAPMYTQLELLRGRRGRLLKYDIALEAQTGSAVSFASVAIE